MQKNKVIGMLIEWQLQEGKYDYLIIIPIQKWIQIIKYEVWFLINTLKLSNVTGSACITTRYNCLNNQDVQTVEKTYI